jgi:DNA-binding NarL/FixJ family response regulator
MSAILLTTDLMTASKAQGAAARAGCALKTVASASALLAHAAEHSASLIILDLSSPAIDPATLVPQLRALGSRPAILAFGPHVHEARLKAAVEAGCDSVIARGQFHAQAQEILARHAAPSA